MPNCEVGKLECRSGCGCPQAQVSIVEMRLDKRQPNRAAAVLESCILTGRNGAATPVRLGSHPLRCGRAGNVSSAAAIAAATDSVLPRVRLARFAPQPAPDLGLRQAARCAAGVDVRTVRYRAVPRCMP